MEALGAVAARMLLAQLAGTARPGERCEIEAPLVLRRSVGPCLACDGGVSGANILLQPWEAP